MSVQHLPDSSRVWVFFANKPLTDDATSQLHAALEQFVKGWKAHGSQLTAGYEILASTAVIVSVDESAAAPSGCSIDKAFRLLTEFGASHNIDFFNRLLLTTAEGKVYTQAEVKLAFATGELGPDTLVLNPMIQNLADMKHAFTIPFNSHWLGARLNNGAPAL
jgi:hypothetical protein